jgi:hypothetical protein
MLLQLPKQPAGQLYLQRVWRAKKNTILCISESGKDSLKLRHIKWYFNVSDFLQLVEFKLLLKIFG